MEHVRSVLDMYPANQSKPVDSLMRFATHALFSCPVRHIANVASAHLYYFLHVPTIDCMTKPLCWGKLTCHQADLQYVFHSCSPEYAVAPDEVPLYQRMQQLWSAFARIGKSALPWIPYNNATRTSMSFVLPTGHVQQGLLDAECALIDSLRFH